MRRVVAFAEEGHPRAVPPEALQVEDYTVSRVGGPLRLWRVRWVLPCPDAPTVDAAIEAGADVLLVLGPRQSGPRAAGAAPEPLPEDLLGDLFQLTGFRQDGPPPRRFQASALPALLEHAHAVVLIHQDKHSSSMGIYQREASDPTESLTRLARLRGALPVPFAIPPMLARWDRALWELRQRWDDRAYGDFPVPPAPESHGRRGRRGGPAPAPVAEEEEEE